MASRSGRILYLAYLAPPAGGSRPLRVEALSTALVRSGHRPDILTIEVGPGYPYRDTDALRRLSHEIQVIRTRPGPLYRLAYGRKRSTQRLSLKPDRSAPVARRLIARAADCALLPDRHVEWLPAAMAQVRSLATKSEYDLVLVSAAPFSSCVVGRLISRVLRVPMVIDLGDPWTGRMGAGKVRTYVDRCMERWVQRNMAALVVTTQATREHYLRQFPALRSEQVHVIPNGYPEELFSREPESDASTPGAHNLHILYTGAVYGHRVGLARFAQSLAAVNQRRRRQGQATLRFVFVGRDHGISGTWREYLGDDLELHGYVSSQEAAQLMQRASALLLLGSEGGLQIPAKVWSYVAARRPILTIAGRRDRELRDLMTFLRRGPVLNDGDPGIEDALETILEMLTMGRSDIDLRPRPELSWRTRGAQFAELVASVLPSS